MTATDVEPMKTLDLQSTEAFPSRNAIAILIHRLNQKLVELGVGERPIRAIRNWGYRLWGTLTVE